MHCCANPVHLHRRLQQAKYGVHTHKPQAPHPLSAIWTLHLQQLQAMTLAECKKRKRKDYTFQRQFNDAGNESR